MKNFGKKCFIVPTLCLVNKIGQYQIVMNYFKILDAATIKERLVLIVTSFLNWSHNKYAARLTSDRRIRVKVGSLVTCCGSVLSSVECLGYKTNNKRGSGIACSDRSKDDLRKTQKYSQTKILISGALQSLRIWVTGVLQALKLSMTRSLQELKEMCVWRILVTSA